MINDDVDEMNDLDELIPNSNESQNNKDEKVSQTEENKEGCQFPSAFTILLIIHCLVFILIYIIPKGKYDTIEYSSGKFIIKSYGKKDNKVNTTKEYLEEMGIKVPLIVLKMDI